MLLEQEALLAHLAALARRQPRRRRVLLLALHALLRVLLAELLQPHCQPVAERLHHGHHRLELGEPALYAETWLNGVAEHLRVLLPDGLHARLERLLPQPPHLSIVPLGRGRISSPVFSSVGLIVHAR